MKAKAAPRSCRMCTLAEAQVKKSVRLLGRAVGDTGRPLVEGGVAGSVRLKTDLGEL